MSIETSSFVLGLSMGRGNGIRKLILLGYANHTDKHGRGAYPSTRTIADYAECDGHPLDARLRLPGRPSRPRTINTPATRHDPVDLQRNRPPAQPRPHPPPNTRPVPLSALVNLATTPPTPRPSVPLPSPQRPRRSRSTAVVLGPSAPARARTVVSAVGAKNLGYSASARWRLSARTGADRFPGI
jgi:hypothetical protein